MTIGLRKYVVDAEGASKAALAKLEAKLPALQRAAYAASETRAGAKAFRAKIDAMPRSTPLQKAWRMQHIDTLNRYLRGKRVKVKSNTRKAA